MNIEQARAAIGPVTAETVSARFGCSIEQAKAGFQRTATVLRNLADECDAARLAGKKEHSGYLTTTEESARLREMANGYDKRAA